MPNNPSILLNKSPHIRYNILFLTKWYPNKFDPQLGVFVRKHAKAVSEFCNVNVLYACADSTLASTYEITISNQQGFNETIVYYKKNNSVIKPIINFFRYINAIRKGFREAQKTLNKIDLIHVNVLSRPGFIALIIHLFRGIPYIITEHWTGYISGKYEKMGILKQWINKRIIKKAATVTTVSEGLKKKMLYLGLQNNYAVVPNIIENVSLSIPENIQLKEVNPKIKILTIADLVDEHKNISGIIEAISAIFKEHTNIEYHIIGGGPDKIKLTSLADSLQGKHKFIFFHDRQTNEYVYSFLEQSDFIIINSNYETFSVVAAEALASGKPVISTRCGGPEEFVSSEYGILIEPNNPEQLKEAIIKMIATYKNYDPKKLNQYISRKYNYHTIGEQFYNIYKVIIKR